MTVAAIYVGCLAVIAFAAAASVPAVPAFIWAAARGGLAVASVAALWLLVWLPALVYAGVNWVLPWIDRVTRSLS